MAQCGEAVVPPTNSSPHSGVQGRMRHDHPGGTSLCRNFTRSEVSEIANPWLQEEQRPRPGGLTGQDSVPLGSAGGAQYGGVEAGQSAPPTPQTNPGH